MIKHCIFHSLENFRRLEYDAYDAIRSGVCRKYQKPEDSLFKNISGFSDIEVVWTCHECKYDCKWNYAKEYSYLVLYDVQHWQCHFPEIVLTKNIDRQKEILNRIFEYDSGLIKKE